MTKIYWTGLEELMQSDQVSKIEKQTMMDLLSRVEASFLQEFGFSGEFRLQSVTTSGVIKINGRLHGGRTSWRIVAGNSRTLNALKRKPGWLSQFF